jgi:hypothetical protein
MSLSLILRANQIFIGFLRRLQVSGRKNASALVRALLPDLSVKVLALKVLDKAL